MSESTESLPIDRDLFDLLVCPESKARLKLIAGRLVSTDSTTRRRYRIDDGIPIMLIEESEVLSEDEWRLAMSAPGPCGAGPEAVRARHASRSS